MSRKNSLLTEKQREYLQTPPRKRKDKYTKQERSYYRREIRERTRAALQDFSLLVDTLPEHERGEIFDVEWGSEEQRDLEQHLSDVIQFIYAGMKGRSWFKTILTAGVRNGEVELGNVENAFFVNVGFDVEHTSVNSVSEAAEHIQNEDWGKLDPADLFAFVRFARQTKGFNIETILEGWEQHQQIQEWFGEYKGGNKQARIPGGKWTPLIDRDVWEERGYGDMSTEERREEFTDLFGEGVSSGANIVYDGKDIFRPPAPGSDEEPEIIDLKEEE